MLKNVLIVMEQATSLSYVGSPINNIQELPGTAEEYPIHAQRGIRDQPANAGRIGKEAEAGRPTVAPL